MERGTRPVSSLRQSRMNKNSLALAILVLLFGIGALWGFFALPGDAGDDAPILEALAPTTSSSTTTTQPNAPAANSANIPTWEANEVSSLEALWDSRGPVPVGLRIEALDIDAPVGAYGVDRNGQMDVPNNITEVGWYKFGAAPGESGSAVLAAHVDLRGPGRGLFWDLDTLNPGSAITVVYSDTSERTFEVVARSTYLKDELPVESLFSEEGPSVLTLITCGGGFSRSEGSYDSNVVVYAVPVETIDADGRAS